jgi:hypothetical protein
VSIFSRILLEADALRVRPVDRFIVDVGDIHDMADPESGECQETFKQVLEDIGPHIPDVLIAVDGRPASVETYLAGPERDEFLDAAAEGVEEANHGPLYWHVRGSESTRRGERPYASLLM